MSVHETQLPDRVERKVTNKENDSWFEYDGEQLFTDNALNRIRNKFHEMREHEWNKIAAVGGDTTTRTKIRTKDIEDFKHDLTEAHQTWLDNHDEPLTNFGNFMYGEQLTTAVGITEENARKTVVQAQYQTGHQIGMRGKKYKINHILLPIRSYEQWSYHKEVVEPLFEKYHEKYPY